eukprot:gene17966-biopygen878
MHAMENALRRPAAAVRCRIWLLLPLPSAAAAGAAIAAALVAPEAAAVSAAVSAAASSVFGGGPEGAAAAAAAARALGAMPGTASGQGWMEDFSEQPGWSLWEQQCPPTSPMGLTKSACGREARALRHVCHGHTITVPGASLAGAQSKVQLRSCAAGVALKHVQRRRTKRPRAKAPPIPSIAIGILSTVRRSRPFLYTRIPELNCWHQLTDRQAVPPVATLPPTVQPAVPVA